METKMIGVYLILSSHIFPSLLGYTTMSLTVEEFDAFQGLDPTTSCGDQEKMKQQCNRFAINSNIDRGTQGFEYGFPECVKGTGVPLTQPGGIKTVRLTNILNCQWKNGGRTYVIGKGKSPNHVMNYACESGGICKPAVDISYDTEHNGKEGKKNGGKKDEGKKCDGKKDD